MSCPTITRSKKDQHRRHWSSSIQATERNEPAKDLKKVAPEDHIELWLSMLISRISKKTAGVSFIIIIIVVSCFCWLGVCFWVFDGCYRRSEAYITEETSHGTKYKPDLNVTHVDSPCVSRDLFGSISMEALFSPPPQIHTKHHEDRHLCHPSSFCWCFRPFLDRYVQVFARRIFRRTRTLNYWSSLPLSPFVGTDVSQPRVAEYAQDLGLFDVSASLV